MNRVADHVADMDQAVTLALSYVDGLTKAEFMKSTLIQQAVVLNLLAIGEAAARVLAQHPAFAVAHPAVPWTQMRGLRIRVAHGYFRLDLNIVWATVTTDLPAPQAQMPSLIGAAKTS